MVVVLVVAEVVIEMSITGVDDGLERWRRHLMR